MKVGTRIVRPDEVGRWDAEILQVSVYRGMEGNIENMRKCVRACRDAGIRYVLHPVSYSLLDNGSLDDLIEMASLSDLALILHDERDAEGGRLKAEDEYRFRRAVEKVSSYAHVSFENATHTGDVHWFWSNFSSSITLDIGHIESFGLDSTGFVQALDDDLINRTEYVHIHRNNGLRGGITDHWPLTLQCREVRALRELLTRKPDVSVLLEINELDMIPDSLAILRGLRSDTAM